MEDQDQTLPPQEDLEQMSSVQLKHTGWRRPLLRALQIKEGPPRPPDLGPLDWDVLEPLSLSVLRSWATSSLWH